MPFALDLAAAEAQQAVDDAVAGAMTAVGRDDGRAVTLAPDDFDDPLAAIIAVLPIELDRTVVRPGAVLGGVRRQLVEHEAYARNRGEGHADAGPEEGQPAVDVVGLEDPADRLADFDAP